MEGHERLSRLFSGNLPAMFVNLWLFWLISSGLVLWAEFLIQISKCYYVFLVLPELIASLWREVFLFNKIVLIQVFCWYFEFIQHNKSFVAALVFLILVRIELVFSDNCLKFSENFYHILNIFSINFTVSLLNCFHFFLRQEFSGFKAILAVIVVYAFTCNWM